jgi:FixJ family two-component response regulator
MQEADGQGPMIILVDDDEGVRLSLDGLLRSAGLQSRMFGSAEEALADPHVLEGACVITDLQMQGLNGLEFAGRLRAIDPAVPILLITAYPTAEAELRAREAGVLFLSKPFQANDLLAMVEAMLGAARSRSGTSPE